MRPGEQGKIIAGKYAGRDVTVHNVPEPDFLYDYIEVDLGEELETRDSVMGEVPTNIYRVDKNNFVSRSSNLDLI